MDLRWIDSHFTLLFDYISQWTPLWEYMNRFMPLCALSPVFGPLGGCQVLWRDPSKCWWWIAAEPLRGGSQEYHCQRCVHGIHAELCCWNTGEWDPELRLDKLRFSGLMGDDRTWYSWGYHQSENSSKGPASAVPAPASSTWIIDLSCSWGSSLSLFSTVSVFQLKESFESWRWCKDSWLFWSFVWPSHIESPPHDTRRWHESPWRGQKQVANQLPHQLFLWSSFLGMNSSCWHRVGAVSWRQKDLEGLNLVICLSSWGCSPVRHWKLLWITGVY